jgi:hydrogenase-1 operon protein HyaF
MSTPHIELPVTPGTSAITANLPPVLHEILDGIRRLRTKAEPTLVDLLAMPFGPGERERLLELLGEGEVTAQVNTLGETRIQESAFPGVWLVEHLNLEGRQIALQIEIAEVPELLRAPKADLRDSERLLAQVLEELLEDLEDLDPTP